MKKKTNREILEKAVPDVFSKNKPIICSDGVWLPVTVDVFEKIKELLRVTGCKGHNGKILQGDFRLGILPLSKDGERAIAITSGDVNNILGSRLS
jgi:hypothetical protein